MDGEFRSGLATALKRHRDPLSDTEDNVHSSDVNDVQKRRRLEVLGEKNVSPTKKSSTRDRLRCAELVKPDTPALCSVRSRVQQLTQRRGHVLAHRCLSDPGSGVPSIKFQDGFKEHHLIGEAEFSSRVERFRSPTTPQASPLPANRWPRTLSNAVTNLQLKLEASDTPSSKQASRIRQEREEELRLVRAQPITENVFLKRSYSDSSLTERATPPVSAFSPWMMFRRSRRLQWPPFQPWNQADLNVTGDEPFGVKDGSFTETSVFTKVDGVEPPIQDTGEVTKSSVHMDVPPKEVKGRHMAEQQAECTMDICQGTSRPDDHETAEGPVVKEQQKAVSPARDKQEERDLVHRGVKFYVNDESHLFLVNPVAMESKGDGEELGSSVVEEQMVSIQEKEMRSSVVEVGSPVDEEVGSLKEENWEVGSFVDEEDVASSLGEKHVASAVGEEEEVVQSQLEKVGDLLGEEMESSGVEEQGKAESILDDIQGEKSVLGEHQGELGPEQGEAANASAVSDREQGDSELLTDEEQTDEPQSEARGLKKVTFILEPEMINDSALSELDSSSSWKRESMSEAELSSRDETNTAEMIDLMFDEVLEAAAQGRMEEQGEEDTEDHNSGIATAMRRMEKTDTELDKDKAEEGEDLEETKELDSSADELLSFPPSFILSPLSKSVEAVVTPMRLAANQLANPPSLLLTPEELTTPPADSAPLYSIDAYRTQRQSTKPAIQSVTPRVQKHAAEKSHPQPCVNTKERIMVLNEDAAKLQTVIKQTLQALSCCTDEDHGRGSLEEAEADKLLLVSCEKRAALLAEVARLKERGGSVSEDLEGGEGDSSMSQQPCRGTVSISSVQLPLKVEFVCSARTRTGRPTHYFFVLIRYGPCNIVATPLATAVDAQNGDTISFPTSITLQDIRSNFEIDVEVYSLSHTSGNTCNVDLRSSTKSRVTPRKLLSTIKRSNQNVTSSTMPHLNTRRTSNFSLVGSHKISLASLGQSKFPLDKMKFEGKIRRLLGDEFQEKVPFLSPLEGNIYLQLDSESHSNVQQQGFLTMFEVVNGFGAWHRRFFVLEGNHMSYWNHPNDRGSKAAEGSISLSSSSSQSVKPVMRGSCARPYTFELVSSVQTAQPDDQGALAKCWFSADTGEDREDWMENLNQVLLDLHTWTRCPPEPC
ncbi:anillin-like isoform X3 [Salvelinus fontinalis]|uniref:anillin-like isoform X3 n=1 Tax=Salvelinus fontinalis TaxID=8038 RepID=UPI0024860338|nr:anillin-like isoform X3 [Salvelinus fontinalis]